MFEGIIFACIILACLCLVAYLNKHWTNWIKVCHTLGYSAKEKPQVVLDRISKLKTLEEDNVFEEYAKAKEELGI